MGRRHWNLSRLVGRETLLALLVLALVFLNFGHASISVGGEHYRLASDSWCGDPLLPNAPDHSPCHACRIGSGADLPPPPCAAEPVLFVVATVDYGTLAARSFYPASLEAPRARGPPYLA